MNSSNIQVLSISNSASKIGTELLSGLSKLETLYLSDNNFHEMPCNIIPSHVKSLYLFGNKITKPNFKSCTFLKSLKLLNLEYNGIEYLEDNVFSDMENIEEINLRHNKLQTFSNDVIKDLKYLKWIDLSGNNLSTSNLNISKQIKIRDY